MQTPNIVVAIDSIGVAEVPNDLATFSVTIRERSESLESAKRQVEEKTAHFVRELKSKNFQMEGDISTSFANYKLEHREGGEKYPAGYQATNTITWTCAIDDNLNSLYKRCLETDSHMSLPVFSVKDPVSVSELALQRAVDNAKDKLKKECDLLGVSQLNLRIFNWNFGYEGYISANANVNTVHGALTSGNFNSNSFGPMGATGPMGAVGMPGPVGPGGHAAPVVTKLGSIYQELLDTKLHVGVKSVRVAVRVNYVWNS